MNKLFQAILVAIAVGLLVIPASVMYYTVLLPYIIVAVAVIGILAYVKIKAKTIEISTLKEMSGRLDNQLIEIKKQQASQSKLIYTVLVRIPQFLESVIKKQEEMGGRIATLCNQFDKCNDAILQVSQIFQNEVKYNKEALTSLSLSVCEGVDSIQRSIDRGMNAQSEVVKNLFAEIISFLKESIGDFKEIVKAQNKILDKVTVTISEDINQGFAMLKSCQEYERQNISKTLEANSKNQTECLDLISKLQGVQSQFENDISNQKSVLEETVAQVNAQIRDSFHGFIRSLNKSNGDLSATLKDQFEGMKEEIEELPDALEDAFKSSVGGSIEELGMSISNLERIVEGLDRFGEHLTRYEEQLNNLSKSETSIMDKFEKIIRGER